MTRKRRAPNYTGALAQPIYVEDYYKLTGGLGQPNRELDIDAIRKRAAEKVRLLYKHYKIDPSATEHEIAAITGHASLRVLERYTKAVDQKKLAASAMEKAKAGTSSVKPVAKFDKKSKIS